MLKSHDIYLGEEVNREGKRVSIPPLVLSCSPEFEQRAPARPLGILEAGVYETSRCADREPWIPFRLLFEEGATVSYNYD
jgi:hypothetical protein